jgi:hypothetical protein
MAVALAAPRSGRGPHGVGIVKAHKALTSAVMQRQRVTQAVRPFRGRLHASHREFHPVLAGWIYNQHLAVKVQQGIQTQITI